MRAMIDCRCPRCNRPVRGREEVVWVTSPAAHKKVTVCPHRNCGTGVRLYELSEADRIVEAPSREFAYDAAPKPSTAVTRA